MSIRIRDENGEKFQKSKIDQILKLPGTKHQADALALMKKMK